MSKKAPRTLTAIEQLTTLIEEQNGRVNKALDKLVELINIRHTLVKGAMNEKSPQQELTVKVKKLNRNTK